MSAPQNAGASGAQTPVLGKRKAEACPCATQAKQKRARREPITPVGALQRALGPSGAGFPDDVIKLVAECTFWRVECSHCCASGLANPSSTAIEDLLTDHHKLGVSLPATGGCSVASNVSSAEKSLEGTFYERVTGLEGEEYEETNRLAYVFDPPSNVNTATASNTVIAILFDRAAAAEARRFLNQKAELRQPAFVCGTCEAAKDVIYCRGCNALFPPPTVQPGRIVACERCHKAICPRCFDPGFEDCDQCLEVILGEEGAEALES